MASEIGLTATERVTLDEPAASAVAREAERQGARRVVLIASRHLAKNTEEIAHIEAELGDRHAVTIDGIRPHVPRSDVIAAADRARDAGADLVVAVGGGSVIEAAKAVPLCLRHDIRSVAALEGFRTRVEPDGLVVRPQFAGPDVRLVCVPTTLSGGEWSFSAGLTDEETRRKSPYAHRTMAPVLIVLDPRITLHTPEWLWLSTGIRSVDHAAETLASALSNPFCDGLAESALRLLGRGLPAVKADPGNLAARLECQVGAWQSMIPVSAGVPMGASHAIGHVLGADSDVPHGYTSCVMAPFVQAWNEGHCGGRQDRIAASLGAPELTAAAALDRLISGLGLPRSLAEVGVTRSRLPAIAEKTMHDRWARTNPRPVREPADVLEILERAGAAEG
ncbi:iron-containing alcohol dehydrogenase [Enterovirga sp. CN4-39]|uniref:iron-containing alcohol dehydrogenase n=1 Tax=Enterovirga sp. CN4-39 TaxID=3400910 RepID=UPI003C09AF7A